MSFPSKIQDEAILAQIEKKVSNKGAKIGLEFVKKISYDKDRMEKERCA